MKPITPDEALQYKRGKIPDYIYDSFNELIKRTFTGHQSCFWQDEVLDHILETNPTVTRSYLFQNHYLDVEHAYAKNGWDVEYDDGHSGKYFKFIKKE